MITDRVLDGVFANARLTVAAAAVVLTAVACGSSSSERAGGDTTPASNAESMRGTQPIDNRCNADSPDHEVSEYDTSGDEWPDVRKVFLRAGDPPLVNLILVCRESDLNGDGTRDVVRYYTEEGRPLREESDRDFSGVMDQILYFESGRVVRMEQDTSGNGVVDTKIFYEEGKPVRAERDLAARSTADEWRPDNWEYYEDGRMVRAGTDLDGDGRVDRWDRDAQYEAERDARARAQESEANGGDSSSSDAG